MNHKWKKLFFLLLGINLAVFIIILTMIFTPGKDSALPHGGNQNEQDVKFRINTNKSDLNRIINHYLEKEGLTGPVDYQVLLKDEVELYGSIPVFSQNLHMKLTFEPKALKNGDLVLKQKSISIGRMQIPVSYAMKFIRDQYKFPNWIIIQPNEEMIYVALQKMEIKSDIKIRANQFDLKRDEIAFTLLVPAE